MYRFVVACGLLVVGAAPVSYAQNINADPNFTTVSLSGGFTPDPYVTSVVSGGGIDASNLGNGCGGSISNAPDVRLNFSAGSLPLIISANSANDTTLVVNAPDGQWYCDDDSGNGLNPSVRFNKVQSGRYEIWLGTYGSGNHSATLSISEIHSE